MNSRVVNGRICRPVVADGKRQWQLAGGGDLGEDVGVASSQLRAQLGAGVVVGGVEQSLVGGGGGEGDLDLGGILLGGDQRGQPLAGDHVQNRDRRPPGWVKWVESPGPDPVGFALQPLRLGLARGRIPRWIAW